MKTGTVRARAHIDVAGNVRAELGRAGITASDLSRWFGGAVTYWTRRRKGELPLSDRDLELIAWACEVHPAVLLGGVATDDRAMLAAVAPLWAA